MKKGFLFLMILITGLIVRAQHADTVFLNKRYEPTVASKAAYLQIKSIKDGIQTNRFIDLKRMTERVEQYKNKKPVGKWQQIKEGVVENEIDLGSVVYLSKEQLKKEVNLIDATDYDTAGFVKPSYVGGDKARISFLGENLIYPQYSRENGEQGQVSVTFILTKEGKIERPTVTTSAGAHLDYESVRVILLMPKWNPATMNGKPVDVLFTMPLKYTLAY